MSIKLSSFSAYISQAATFIVVFILGSTALAQPANDNPCNATALTAGPSCTYVSATNVGATSSPGVPAPGCASYSNNDVWFSIVVPPGGVLNVDSNTGTMTDGGMAAYTGTCSSLSLLSCNDDSSPNGAMPLLSLTGLTPGATIFIRFWKYGGGTGTFSICATAPEPAPPCGASPAAGNTCATATPICNLNGYCGNTSASYTANSWSQGCGFLNLSDCGLTGEFCGSIENNSFLSFVASGTSISFDVWVNSSTMGYGIQIMIFSASGGCSGTVTQYGPCYNPGTVESGPINITAGGLTSGNTYYIMIDGNSGDVCNYTIGANSGVSLPVAITPVTSTICAGETVSLTASGGNGTYTWNATPQLNTTTGANVIATPPGPGTYTYTANSTTGNTACPSATSAVATVTVNPCGCTVTAANSGPVCSGSTVNLTATNLAGATFTWTGPNGFTSSSQNPSNIAVPTTAGTYTYTVTATLGAQTCTSTTDVVVNANPTVNAGNDVAVCQGASVTLTATGASTYTWSPTATNGTAFIPAATGVYTVTGTTAVGCTATDQVSVTVNTCGCTVNTGNTGPVCPSGTIDLTATNLTGATWSWTGPNGFTSTSQNVSAVVMPSIAGTYSYTVTATVGASTCTSTTDVVVLASPIIDAGLDVAVCSGENVTLTASGATSYAWSSNVINGTAFIPNSTAIYTVTGTDASGCIGTDQLNVTVNPLPLVNAGSDVAVCQGESVTLTASGANTYAWTPSNVSDGVSFVPAASGTYSVSGTSLEGCLATDQLTVTVNPIPTVNAGNDVVVCQGESVVLTGTGATTYSWSPVVTNGVAFTPSTSGTYTVTGTSNGCTNVDDVVVTVNPAPAITFTANPLIGCAPLDVTFTNTTVGASNCQWSFGNGLSSTDCSSATTTYSQPGCYDITLSATALGCISTLTVPNFICVEADPVASFNTSTGSVGVFNSVVQFSNSSVGASSYSWSFDNGNGLSTLEDPSYEFPSEPGTYNVMLLVSSPLGCTDTAFATIVVNEELIFYVPNTFTPDNDMFNQQFLPIFTSGYDPYDYSLSIYNRWGELIFESHDASVGWDGNYGSGGNFKQVQDGTYTWKIEFKVTKNDERKMAVGSVNILR